LAPSKGIAALFMAAFSFGSAAIFIRYATQVSAISLTFFRLLIASAAVILFAISTGALRKLGKHVLLLVAISGIMLSLHFTAFIFAVKETTVANATFLVNTSPVMLAVLSPLILKERTTSREYFGVLLAILGILFVANAGNSFRSFGLPDLSALLAAFFVALYSLVGRYLRTRGVGTASYTAYVYSTAAVVAFLMVEGSGASAFQPYDPQNIVAILGLGLIPTALGHSLYNYSLRSVKTVTANLFPMLEPVIASALAVPLFQEIPNSIQCIGYALILAAVAVVARTLA